MRKALGAALLIGLPALAQAQAPPQVPAIARVSAAAVASASVSTPSDHAAGAGAADPTSASTAKVAAASTPATMPPQIPLVSPSAPLNAKEQHAVSLARRWANRAEMPQRGEDGVIRFLYGATLPTVVCAPLQVCDLALQPGEIVNNVNVGDKVRWNISPAISGSPEGQITHLIIKPVDAGLVSSMTIETNRRTYAIKLVSTQHEWMPLVAFSYPDDMQRQWSAYRQNVAWGAAASTLPSGQNIANLDFGFRISGDDPSWRPFRVYTDGAKTYIQFPRAMAFGAAPALVGLDNNAGWFSSPVEQMINYRIAGDRYIVDRVLDRAKLVSGVGSGQTSVLITRDGPHVAARPRSGLPRGLYGRTEHLLCGTASAVSGCARTGARHGRVRRDAPPGRVQHCRPRPDAVRPGWQRADRGLRGGLAPPRLCCGRGRTARGGRRAPHPLSRHPAR